MTGREELLGQAVELAAQARASGNHPFGALLADRSGHVVLTAQNTVVTNSDVTGHAETNLVRAASGVFSADELASLVLYTSTEPCAMCAGAIYWSGIGGVVFALAESELATMTGSDPQNPTLDLPCRDVFAAGQRAITVVGPVDIAAARDVHAGFWAAPGPPSVRKRADLASESAPFVPLDDDTTATRLLTSLPAESPSLPIAV